VTKLRWDRAGHHNPDPGAVVEVRDSGLPPSDKPLETKAARAKRYAQERKKLAVRSEKTRQELIRRKRATESADFSRS